MQSRCLKLYFNNFSAVISCIKILTNTNAGLKIFCMQKGISFIDNSGIKEFHLGKRKHLKKKGNSEFAKNVLHYINRTD